jgi:hypothetical protein
MLSGAMNRRMRVDRATLDHQPLLPLSWDFGSPDLAKSMATTTDSVMHLAGCVANAFVTF